jgi:hypothetical protein
MLAVASQNPTSKEIGLGYPVPCPVGYSGLSRQGPGFESPSEHLPANYPDVEFHLRVFVSRRYDSSGI